MSTLLDDQTKLGNAEAVAVKLRVGLDTLLNAASDLEAAMDGTTGEFKEELDELRKAIRIAANLIGKRENREQQEDIDSTTLTEDMLRFYTDRLRVVTNYETGASEDEIDRLEFENEMLRQDKNRYRDENVEMKAITLELLSAAEMVSNFNWKNNRTHLLEIVNAAIDKAKEKI